MNFRSNIKCRYYDYGFIQTPLFKATSYSSNADIYVKLEGQNLFGNIKSRSAFYMLNSVATEYKPVNGRLNVVESSSGNLALALHNLSDLFSINFLCLTDSTTSELKQKKLIEEGVNLKFVEIGNNLDLRTARINMARSLHAKGDFIWLNQYNNNANALAHYETTAPEIFKQANQNVDWIIVSVGSGGTISGIARYLKERDSNIKVVGVEPIGSTSFGGHDGMYITAGAGMRGPSQLLKSNFQYIDFFAQVSDETAARECNRFWEVEGVKVGLTSGHCLAVASKLSKEITGKVIVISPDSGDHYEHIIDRLLQVTPFNRDDSISIMPLQKIAT